MYSEASSPNLKYVAILYLPQGPFSSRFCRFAPSSPFCHPASLILSLRKALKLKISQWYRIAQPSTIVTFYTFNSLNLIPNAVASATHSYKFFLTLFLVSTFIIQWTLFQCKCKQKPRYQVTVSGSVVDPDPPISNLELRIRRPMQ